MLAYREQPPSLPEECQELYSPEMAERRREPLEKRVDIAFDRLRALENRAETFPQGQTFPPRKDNWFKRNAHVLTAIGIVVAVLAMFFGSGFPVKILSTLLDSAIDSRVAPINQKLADQSNLLHDMNGTLKAL